MALTVRLLALAYTKFFDLRQNQTNQMHTPLQNAVRNLHQCKTVHTAGCVTHRQARERNKQVPDEVVSLRKDGVDFFSLSSELVLPFQWSVLEMIHREWVLCDCDPASPCFSASRCHEAARYRRAPLVPEKLLMPNLAGARKMVRWVGTNEPFMVDAIVSILRSTCSSVGAKFVDSGMNEGMWTVLAAAFGCRPIGIEPQPQCISSVQAALQVNRLSAVILNAMLAPTDTAVTIDTSQPCFGGKQMLADVNGENDPSGGETAEATKFGARVGSIRLDSLKQLFKPQAHVELWHLDVEGAEIKVLRSASRLFAAGKIKRVIFEVSHLLWSRFGIASIGEGYRELKSIFTGWTCTWACNDLPFPWQPVPLKRVYCAWPWNQNYDLGYGLFDVFCVAPGVDRIWNSTTRFSHLVVSAPSLHAPPASHMPHTNKSASSPPPPGAIARASSPSNLLLLERGDQQMARKHESFRRTSPQHNSRLNATGSSPPPPINMPALSPPPGCRATGGSFSLRSLLRLFAC
mmetsp:Transcript_76532/g.127577  ORF Transcript_76532/g.127577 Transcript_76532/m.127577 type:complete len:518 (-) Transcript_76532:369-1922(-)